MNVARGWVVGVLAVSAWLGFAVPAQARDTVECHSVNYQYDECWAGHLDQPQLIYQSSSSACILNRTWGYNPNSGYIWVAQGCAGVFADAGGYHHGRGDTYDEGARRYDRHGHDAGEVVAGAVLGAIIAGAASGSHKHSASNVDHDRHGDHSGCHGEGCDFDPRPQFDRDGNPNFDTHGNWQGCHGMGCLVDNPDDK